MSRARYLRLALGATAFCVGGIAFYKFNHVESDSKGAVAYAAGWEQVDARYVKWEVHRLIGRIPSTRWTVEYEYMVKGVLYRGNNINPRSTSIVVGYGDFPIDIMVRINEIKTVWYDPRAPKNSAVFNGGTEDIKTAIYRAYTEQVIIDKENGRWP